MVEADLDGISDTGILDSESLINESDNSSATDMASLDNTVDLTNSADINNTADISSSSDIGESTSVKRPDLPAQRTGNQLLGRYINGVAGKRTCSH